MNCTVIIFHFESLAYLRCCVRQIFKCKRDDIHVKVIIADQSVDVNIKKQLYTEFVNTPDVSIVSMSQYGSGYAVDYLIRNYPIYTDYICTIDVDTIPIHKNWLYVPIKLIEEKGFAFAGVHAQVEEAYGGGFFCICQHYRVGRTTSYKELSLNGGFTKNDHRNKLSFFNNEWKGWSDDAIVAHWWEDKYYNHDKFTFAVSHYLGVAPTEGRFGRYTDDLVFHIGFSYNWKMVRNRKECMGDEFIDWMERMERDGFTDELLGEMLGALRPLEAPIPRVAWNGSTKLIYTPNAELNEYIDKLKGE